MKTLYMVFKLDTGKNVTLALKSPKNDLARAAVEPVMQSIIDKEAIKVGTGYATEIADAYIREVNDTEII